MTEDSSKDVVQRAEDLENKIEERAPNFESLTEYGHRNRFLMFSFLFILVSLIIVLMLLGKSQVDKAHNRAEESIAAQTILSDDVIALRAQVSLLGVPPIAPAPSPEIIIERGETGEEGRGPTIEEIFAGIATYCAAADEPCRGFTGLVGESGSFGVDGEDGVDGLNGTNGVDGLNGVNGKDGKDGVDGTNGVDGVNGLDGATGSQGPPPSSFSFTYLAITYTCTPISPGSTIFQCS